MKIRSENNMDYLVAFNQHLVAVSKSTRRTKAVLTWGLPLVAYVKLVLSTTADTLMGIAVIGAIVAGLWVVVFPRLWRWSIDRNARQLYSEGVNKGTLGPHELELADGRLVERNPYGDSRTSLAAIEQVESNGDYAFVFMSALSAHVISHRAIQEGEVQAFADAIKRQLSKRVG